MSTPENSKVKKPRDLGRVALVGGTGRLAGLAGWLAPRSTQLTLCNRAPHDLAAKLDAEPLAIDWQSEDSLTSLMERKFDMVISWLHDEGQWVSTLLEELIVSGGRSIRLHNSKSVDPKVRNNLDPAPRPDITRQIAVLAWDEYSGSRRWLTDIKICEGMIQQIEAPSNPLLIIGEHLYD